MTLLYSYSNTQTAVVKFTLQKAEMTERTTGLVIYVRRCASRDVCENLEELLLKEYEKLHITGARWQPNVNCCKQTLCNSCEINKVSVMASLAMPLIVMAIYM